MLRALLLHVLMPSSLPVAKIPHALGRSYRDRTLALSAKDSRGHTRDTHMGLHTHVCDNSDRMDGGPCTMPCHSAPEVVTHGTGGR